jgi:hypothetical protein
LESQVDQSGFLSKQRSIVIYGLTRYSSCFLGMPACLRLFYQRDDAHCVHSSAWAGWYKRWKLRKTKPTTNLKLQIATSRSSIPAERVERRILSIRGQKVMLSTDIAELYQVAPKVLMQAVKRNLGRFPDDFMFQLKQEEFANLKSQIVTSSWGGVRRATPYAFTEQGVAMLSSVLRSKRAVQVNIAIMRAFVKLREILASNRELARRLNEMEKKYDRHFKIVFDAIRDLMKPPEMPRRRIGFGTPR